MCNSENCLQTSRWGIKRGSKKMNNKILIIDDDIELCRLLIKCVEIEGITAEVAHSGVTGLKQSTERDYQLAIYIYSFQ